MNDALRRHPLLIPFHQVGQIIADSQPQHPVGMAVADMPLHHGRLFRKVGLFGGQSDQPVHGGGARKRNAAVNQHRQYDTVREVIDWSPVMAGKICRRANGGNNSVCNFQKDILAHLGAAAVDKSSRHYESRAIHDDFVSFSMLSCL